MLSREEAGALQGRIDQLRQRASEERDRLKAADANVSAIAAKFKRIMVRISFPGVSDEDDVVIDPRNWRPVGCASRSRMDILGRRERR